jgi:glycosyltransferase involved in cell wall biosynthesis
MMQGIFIYYNKIDKNKLTGIDKKVLWQIENFNNNGLKCRLVEMGTKRKNKFDRIINALACRLPYGNAYPTWKYSDYFDNIDYLYFRRPGAYTAHMIKILSTIKQKNPNIKIIMEIPTYPYDKELMVNAKFYPLYIKDIYNRRKLKNFIDRIAIQNDIDSVFNIKTLHFSNGLKFDDVKIRKPIEGNNEINICAVASLEPWDGYERIFYGLKKYYENSGERDIRFHIAGDGNEGKYYRELVKKLGIEKSVIFHGRLNGKELDNIYNISDLALDVFGMFKKNNDFATSLKSREYLAKGLPMIIGCNVDVITKEFPYFLQFENDDSVIDIEEIVNFYNAIYSGEKSKIEIAKEIREYAYHICDISNSMKEVIEYIQK